jgi:hypothetical protein
MAQNFLQLWYSLLSLETKIRSPNRRWKIIWISRAISPSSLIRTGPSTSPNRRYCQGPLIVKLLPLEAIQVSESAQKDHAVLGCENIYWAELISLVNIQVTGVLRVDSSVPGSFGVVVIMYLDLCWVLWSSLEVLDEIIPKVQNWYARVNLIPPGG